jgi:hypothetical protein
MELEFPRRILKILKRQISWIFFQWEPEFFHADGQTDRHDEVNIRFRNFAKAPKNQP